MVLTAKTTFILGAGFSHEVGLPLGKTLKGQIAGMLPDLRRRQYGEGPSGHQGNPTVREALSQENLGPNTTAALALRRALPLAISIDNLVEHHSDDPAYVYCAKVGIAAAIIAAERQSSLHFAKGGALKLEDIERTPKNSSAPPPAFISLFRLLISGASKAELSGAFEGVAFINFNYDRCLEHFLFNCLQIYSGTKREVAAKLVQELKIWHPYGNLGPLPWMSRPGMSLEFGEDLTNVHLPSVASNLKTYSESVGTADQHIKDHLDGSHQVIFLGCAYHDQNMRLVRPDPLAYRTPIYGTACGESQPDRDIVSDELDGWRNEEYQEEIRPSIYEKTVHIEDMTCAEFLAKWQNTWKRASE